MRLLESRGSPINASKADQIKDSCVSEFSVDLMTATISLAAIILPREVSFKLFTSWDELITNLRACPEVIELDACCICLSGAKGVFGSPSGILITNAYGRVFGKNPLSYMTDVATRLDIALMTRCNAA